jgi:hypothetical protein
MDHLVYILIHRVIPYYMARHDCQEHGFEGPDLYSAHRSKVEALADLIVIDNIEEVIKGEVYLVRSQSDPKSKYHVNIDAYTCDCDSFSLISFCKHIGAVQNHFPKIPTACHPNSKVFPQSTASADDDTLSVTMDTRPSSPTTEIVPNGSNSHDFAAVMEITDKLQRLAVRMHLVPPQLTNNLRNLGLSLDQILAESVQPQVLPERKMIAPNQHSWTETAKVMGAPVKSKRARIHTDPFSGGERSGKKAKPDARVPLVKPTASRCIFNIFTPSAYSNDLSSHIVGLPLLLGLPKDPPLLVLTRIHSLPLRSCQEWANSQFPSLELKPHHHHLYPPLPGHHHLSTCIPTSLLFV